MTNDRKPAAVPIEAVQPSQPYVNGAKLAVVVERFDFDEPTCDAPPVREIGGEKTLIDGHTRAVCAVLAGVRELRVYEDTDDLPMDLYVECVRWCHEAGVTRVEDLVGRVVSDDTFERRWIERCQQQRGG